MQSIEIDNIADVIRFFQSLYDACDLCFHPDDNFMDHVDINGQPVFTGVEALVLDGMMEKCFFVCEKAGHDLYEVAHEIHVREIGKRGILHSSCSDGCC